MVDELAGHFDDAVRGGDRFHIGSEQAARPAAPNLARASYAVTMVHGMIGDEERRHAWLRINVDLGVDDAELRAGFKTGWAPILDALLALHRDDPEAALHRLNAGLDDPPVSGFWNTGLLRPWYAALWAEAAVLADHPDAASRLERSPSRSP